MKTPGEITEVLQRVTRGEDSAFQDLLSLVYEELRALARRAMRGERRDHTLDPTALVHEAYLKLLGQAEPDWQNRAHFFGIAARAMRQILVDHARKGSSRQRRDGRREPLSQIATPSGGASVDLVALDEALDLLQKKNERQSRVVELRYFGGLSPDETAVVLGVTRRTVDRDWRYAQVWLLRELEGRTRSAEGESHA